MLFSPSGRIKHSSYYNLLIECTRRQGDLRAAISTFIAMSVATDESNLCNTSIYSTDKSQNGRHTKISKGPYTAWGPFILKCQGFKRYKGKSRVENMLLNTTGETGHCLQPTLPLLNANFTLQVITFKSFRIDYNYFLFSFNCYGQVRSMLWRGESSPVAPSGS